VRVNLGREVGRMEDDGDGRSAGHDTKDGGKERCGCGWQRKRLSTDHMYRSNLIGQDPSNTSTYIGMCNDQAALTVSTI